MTWEQIKTQYSGKWVKLEQIEWESEGSPNIISAVVTKVANNRPSSQDMLGAAEGKYSIPLFLPLKPDHRSDILLH